jgi:hypothetical protein
MNKRSILVISFIGVLIFIGLIFTGCAIPLIKDMRGYGLIIYSLILVLGGVISVFIFMFSYVANFGASKATVTSLILLPGFLYAYVITLRDFFVHNCSR